MEANPCEIYSGSVWSAQGFRDLQLGNPGGHVQVCAERVRAASMPAAAGASCAVEGLQQLAPSNDARTFHLRAEGMGWDVY